MNGEKLTSDDDVRLATAKSDTYHNYVSDKRGRETLLKSKTIIRKT